MSLVHLPARMRPTLPRVSAVLACTITVAALTACASTPAAHSSPWTEGNQATVDGTVTTVDTAPWAYDGNARLVMATQARGAVTVSLPARWNLCKAQGIDQAGTLKVGDRVRATGTVDAQGALLVCEQPTHRIERLAN